MRIKPKRIKKRNTKSRIGNIHSKKGVNKVLGRVVKDFDSDENVKLTCMDNIRNRAKLAMGGKRLTKQEAKKILEIIRNEK